MIQETLLKSKDRQFVRLQDYTLYFSNAANDMQDPKLLRNRGLLTAVANHIPSKIIKQIDFGLGIDSLSVEIALPGKKVTKIHNIYIHHEQKSLNINLTALEGDYIMGGDFNCRHESWGDKDHNAYGIYFRNLIDDHANAILLNDYFQEPTTTNETAIDLVIASPALANKLSMECLDYVSDIHLAISISYDTPVYAKKQNFVPRLKIDETNWEKYQEVHNNFFNNIDLESHNNMDILLAEVVKGFHEAINLSVPKTRYVPTPWKSWFWNQECEKVRNKMNHYTKGIRKLIPGSLGLLKQAKIEAKGIYLKAQEDKWQEITTSISFDKNCGNAWRRIKNIYNGGVTYKGKADPDPKGKADELMGEFAGRTATSNLDQDVIDTLDELKPARLKVINKAIGIKSESCDPFTSMEMDQACSITKKSAPGTDDLTYTFVNKAPQSTRDALLKLCNLSYEQQRLPSDWKEAGIIAIPKQGSKAFRPITLLSCLDKIMERMIAGRLNHELQDFEEGIIGFVPGRGTADGLTILSAVTTKCCPPPAPLYNPTTERPPLPSKPTANEAKAIREQGSRKNNVKNLKNKPKLKDNSKNKKFHQKNPYRKRRHQIHVIFVDFEKAFELVRSEVVLEAAVEMGIKGNLLAWIKDYLSDRKGHVNFQGETSDTLGFENGTPQGSVISPLLFNLVMNKLVRKEDYPKSVTLVSYADDVKIINHLPKKKPKDFLKALRIFERKCRELGLKISIEKTKAMCYGVQSRDALPTYYLNGEPVEWVKKYKYLGVMYDKRLNFKEHVSYLKKKLRPKINLLKSLAGASWGTSTKTLRRYYLSNIRSILEYGGCAMLTACESTCADIEAIQNNCLRIILHAPPGTPTEVLQAEANVLPIFSRRSIQAIKLLAKIAASPKPHPLSSIIEQDLNKNLKGVFPYATWAMRASQLLKDYDFELPERRENEVKLKPWAKQSGRSLLTIDVDPEYMGKSKMTISEKGLLADRINDKLREIEGDGDIVIYTDGSVSGDGEASYGVHMKEIDQDDKVVITNHSSKLFNKHGSMIAELAAIDAALGMGYNSVTQGQGDHKDIHIITDSLSALHAIQRPFPRDNRDILNSINASLSALEDIATYVTLTWIPSHIGVIGNEFADTLANEGQALEPTINIATSEKSRIADLQFRVKESWKHTVKMSPKAGVKRYLLLNPSLREITIPLSSRYDEATMARLRLSAGKKCTHHCPTICNRCEAPFSIPHYLINCPATPEFSNANKQVLWEEEHDLGDDDKLTAIILQVAASDPQPLIDRIKETPIEAICLKGHPTWKQYGRCRKM